MPDAKLSALEAATALAGTDFMYVVQGAAQKKATLSLLAALLGGGGDLTLVGTDTAGEADPNLTHSGLDQAADGTYLYQALLYNSTAGSVNIKLQYNDSTSNLDYSNVAISACVTSATSLTAARTLDTNIFTTIPASQILYCTGIIMKGADTAQTRSFSFVSRQTATLEFLLISHTFNSSANVTKIQFLSSANLNPISTFTLWKLARS